MSRSVHASRPKFRKASKCDYSSDEERIRVLGKIADEVMLKRTMKANARLKKQAEKAGLKQCSVYAENCAAASKKSSPTPEARELVQKNYLGRKSYG
jgi:hypothetical protein